jgi:hypothetical protein
MILNTGSRTDIPAFYTPWLVNRLSAGEVMVRSPYNPSLITRYKIDPRLVDLIVFCTKNPAPMLNHMDALAPYDTFWHVTITPYGHEIEPAVPAKVKVAESFRKLSRLVGSHRIAWRYDPILITERYSVPFHVNAFSELARLLKGYTTQVVISFIDLYEKTRRNFPEARAVSAHDQLLLTEALSSIAAQCGMQVHLCCESAILARDHVDADGCLSQAVLEKALGERLQVPRHKPARDGCQCLLGADIGAYNTCPHFCRYCYANYDAALVNANRKAHDPRSPLLVGWPGAHDTIRDAVQKSWKSPELSLF